MNRATATKLTIARTSRHVRERQKPIRAGISGTVAGAGRVAGMTEIGAAATSVSRVSSSASRSAAWAGLRGGRTLPPGDWPVESIPVIVIASASLTEVGNV